jgi:hypothetical protein
MRRSWFAAALGTVILSHLLAQTAFALATEQKGNHPFSELNYTEWKGIMPLVNDPLRIYESWANGNEHLFYKGNTKQLSQALVHFAKVEVKNHVVVLRPGPGTAQSFDRTQFPCNWELHILGGIARTRATDDIEDLYWQKDPVLTVYIGGDIDLEKLEIPKGVTLRGAPGTTEAAMKNTDAQKKIAEFLGAWKKETAK